MITSLWPFKYLHMQYFYHIMLLLVRFFFRYMITLVETSKIKWETRNLKNRYGFTIGSKSLRSHVWANCKKDYWPTTEGIFMRLIVRKIIRSEKLQNDFDPIAMIQYGWLTIFIPCDFVDWKASIWAIEPLKLTSRQQLSWCGHFPYEW